jgi:hypothetical protein
MSSALKKACVLTALAAGLAMAAPASAAEIVWHVSGTFTAAPVPSIAKFGAMVSSNIAALNGGTISGDFITEGDGDDMTVVAIDLTTSAYKSFASEHYTDVDMIDAWNERQMFRITMPSGFGWDYELELNFSPLLDPDGKSPSTVTGYEHQEFPGSGNRSFTAIATPTLAAPEPGVWALMVLGFGLAGAALRRRRLSPAG